MSAEQPGDPAHRTDAPAHRTDAPAGLREMLRALAGCPRGLWVVIGAFVFESMAYFGALTLMTSYLSTDLGWSDAAAGITVSAFTMAVTLLMLGAGSHAERFGLRRAILFALVLSTVARAGYSLAVGHSGVVTALLVGVGLLCVAVGSAILQPLCYSGVKQYTDERTSSMGYGLIYALMNLGIVVIGGLSAYLRPAVQRVVDGSPAPNGVVASVADHVGSGVQAMNWVGVAITGLTAVVFAIAMTDPVERAKLRPELAPAPASAAPALQRLRAWFSEGPFGDKRFLFFIFMLLPVRTLFAHQWLTMPEYILRAYPSGVGDSMELIVNWINPLIIFIGVPILTALTRSQPVYRVMMIGTLVSALPTFLLVGGPSLTMLITYMVIFSIGEALWSARFLEYASELAPEGKLAQYMGMANIPWLLAKGTTGLYSGMMLARYCPPDTPPEQLQTGTMWLIYAFVAMSSPIGLWLARGWVARGASLDAHTPSSTGG